MTRYTIFAAMIAALVASCTPTVTVQAPVASCTPTATVQVEPEPAPVASLEDGAYKLTDFTMVARGYTFDADTALTFMPFSSYRGELILLDGVAEFAFYGTIGSQVIEQRSDTWSYEGLQFTDDGIVQVYYLHDQLQVRDKTRASVDSITYTFMRLGGDS